MTSYRDEIKEQGLGHWRHKLRGQHFRRNESAKANQFFMCKFHQQGR